MISDTVNRLARFMALAGGLILTALVILTCVSVIGRAGNTVAHSDWFADFAPNIAAFVLASNIGPVAGDFEILEAGVAFAVFAFLPICQLRGAHATVDIFAQQFSTRTNKYLVAFWDIVLTVFIVLITIRLWGGLESKHINGETTYILEFPVWWAYAASFGAAITASVTALYCSSVQVSNLFSGKTSTASTEASQT